MNINTTLIGEMILCSIIIGGALSYYFARRKTTSPKITAAVGALLSIVPILGLIYVALLALKDDIAKT
ncbi:hypothetical protein [Thalassotalea montiporae]